MRARGRNEIIANAEPGQNEKRFKGVLETYRKITLAMVMGMMYPNPRTEKRRIIYLSLMSGSFFPVYIMWFYDVIQCIQNLDVDNLTRQLSLGVPIMFCQYKMVLINVLRAEMLELIQIIDADYEHYNHLDEGYQKIVRENRNSLLKLENLWMSTVITTVAVFPLMAVFFMIYHTMFKEPKRFMVHDIDVPWLNEARYETPYFEILFIYMLYVAFILVLCYAAYDGMFFICIYHACLKIDLISYGLLQALKAADVATMKKNIANLVEEQCASFKFIHRIKKEYELWLVLVFGLTGIQICMSMYQLTSTSEVDPRYIIFVVAAILHIYVPCYLISMLVASAAEVSNSAYCSGWEEVPDSAVRRSIGFMIARAQIPMQVQALNMITFNMELFVSVMQTAYSVLTLLRPRV